MSLSLSDRFWPKVEVTNTCWIWRGAVTTAGYGVFNGGERTATKSHRLIGAHRFAYEQQIGPIPDGLELDHLCRVTQCVNPCHLEPVTHKENSKRGKWPASARTHCPAGHEYSEDNTHIDRKGYRRCKLCNRDRLRAMKAKA